jgi:signal transduction histidine kinase
VTNQPLDRDLETTAYYVAAEAITNAVKHAEAGRIVLDVDVVESQLHVRVTDDGSGRQPSVLDLGWPGWSTGSALTVGG